MNPNVRAPASKTSSSILLRERENDIEILILNRPQARNSLSKALLGALSDTLTEISKDHATRAVVIAASGSAFSAGHDLKELTSRRSDRDGGREFFRHIMESCSAMMQQIVTLPQPVIAAVQGVASAAGCQLVASCDLAVASIDARLGCFIDQADQGVASFFGPDDEQFDLSVIRLDRHAPEIAQQLRRLPARDAARLAHERHTPPREPCPIVRSIHHARTRIREAFSNHL